MTILRPSWDKTYMDFAVGIAEHSTCARLHVGAVLVKDKRCISVGYNGTPSGAEHCYEVFEGVDLTDPLMREKHHDFSSKYEIHAEMNCLAYAARLGVSAEGGTLYVTTSPCMDCAKLIKASGIKRVVYLNEYNRTQEGSDFLRKNGVEVTKFGEDTN